MKKNSTLFRKLKAYSAMAGSFVAIAGTANGQAFYTDVDPDATFDENGTGYFIDLNNDGTNDFSIQFVQATGTSQGIPYSYRGVFAKPYNGASVAASTSNLRIYDLALDAGEMINAGLAWNNDASQTMGSLKAYPSGGSAILQYGNFVSVEDKYLPLRFKISNVNHYGWARFDVSENLLSFTIKDFAYNTADNQGLFAGQGDPTSVDAVPLPASVKIFAYDGVVNAILVNQQISNASLVITNILGQQVKAMNVTHEFTRTDVSDLPSGIYVVTINNGGSSHAAKVAIRK
jgi:hypothetical protein